MRPATLGAFIAVACAVALALSGCGSSCAAEAGVCRTHSPGDHKRPHSPDDIIIVETRCYKRSEIDERRKDDRDMLERAQMNSNRPVRNKGPAAQ